MIRENDDGRGDNADNRRVPVRRGALRGERAPEYRYAMSLSQVPKNDRKRVRGCRKFSPIRIPIHEGRTKTIQIFINYGEMFLP